MTVRFCKHETKRRQRFNRSGKRHTRNKPKVEAVSMTKAVALLAFIFACAAIIFAVISGSAYYCGLVLGIAICIAGKWMHDERQVCQETVVKAHCRAQILSRCEPAKLTQER